MKPLLVIALVAVIVVGCGKSEGEKDKIYDIKGKVVSLDPGKKTVQLDHEDIPGLMKAMVMPFEVQDPKTLEGLKAGDQVQGKLKTKNGSYTILELKKR